MKILIAMLVLIGTTPLFAAAPDRPPGSPGKSGAWASHVTRMPRGFLVGDPGATVRVVVYASLTCPVCRPLAGDAMAPLRARVAAGEVSYEFRPYAVHSHIDLVLDMLLTCAGPKHFNAFSNDFFADQTRLMEPAVKWWNANLGARWDVPAIERVPRARQWGFLDFAERHGLTPAKAIACVSDESGWQAQIAATREAATTDNVSGTPTFFVNDQRIDGVDWPSIDAAIAAAGVR